MYFFYPFLFKILTIRCIANLERGVVLQIPYLSFPTRRPNPHITTTTPYGHLLPLHDIAPLTPYTLMVRALPHPHVYKPSSSEP